MIPRNIIKNGKLIVRKVYADGETVIRPYAWIDLSEIKHWEQATTENEVVFDQTTIFDFDGEKYVIDMSFDVFSMNYFAWDNERIAEKKCHVLN